MIKYPSIEQFRNVIHRVNHLTTFTGLDDNGSPIYDSSLELPVLKFEGTVKLHGTNAAVCFNEESGMYVQSRKNVITPEKDNAGFATFVYKNKDLFSTMIEEVVKTHKIDTSKNTISIYGEWCGGNIQKGVGINGLPKMFVVFDLKITPHEESTEERWLSVNGLNTYPDNNIYNITEFPTYEIDIDFNDPKRVQNTLQELTLEVEKECPVAKKLGNIGVGEGIVWKTKYKGHYLAFKVKGEKHSVTKVKKLAAVDIEKLDSIKEFVEYAVTENRLNQGYKELFPTTEPTIKDTGTFVKWVNGDVCKEELDTLVDNGLEMKDVGGAIAKKASKWFRDRV